MRKRLIFYFWAYDCGKFALIFYLFLCDVSFYNSRLRGLKLIIYDKIMKTFVKKVVIDLRKINSSELFMNVVNTHEFCELGKKYQKLATSKIDIKMF